MSALPPIAGDKKSGKKSKGSRKSGRKQEQEDVVVDNFAFEASSTGSKNSKGEAKLPGESSDGRMGADIQLLITDITDYRDLLNRHTADDKANLTAIEREIDVLEYRQMKIESRLQKRKTAKKEYTTTLIDTERAFNQIVNTANSVANILKPPTEQELSSMDVPDTAKNVRRIEDN